MKPNKVITEKGSIYTYLDNGKTQRYKAATGETHKPQNVLVFIPNHEWIQDNCPHGQAHLFGENENQYSQKILGYVHLKGRKTHIINESGKRLEDNLSIAKSEKIIMTFENNGNLDFYMPVSKDPKIGFFTYDTRLYKEGGRTMRERHIGNKVIAIN